MERSKAAKGRRKRGEKSASSTSFGSNIEDELMAAFAWARMDKAERKKFKKERGGDLKAIVAHATSSVVFDYTAFTLQSGKKNFGEYLSRHLATRFASALSNWFNGILPSPDGTSGHESRARTSKGYKKLDVNYSTPELGLGLGVSLKTINARDSESKRYTKNFSRVDAELRAEAADYHERQPYSTLVAVIFLPLDACDDATEKDPSSFGAAVKFFRNRNDRQKPSDSHMLFEKVFIGLYDTQPGSLGETIFFDVQFAPPWKGRPTNATSFDQVISEIVAVYDKRNNPEFIWQGAAPEQAKLQSGSASLADELDDEGE